MTRPISTLSSLFLIAATSIGVQTAIAEEASADTVGVHLGGSISAHVNVDGVIGAVNNIVGAVSRVEAGVSAGISVGLGLSAPPPPPPVPSYYVDYPAPVYQPPVHQAVYVDQPIAPRPPLRRWGLGVFAGSVQVDEQDIATDLGLVGRYRLSRSWAVEGEVAKSESTDSARVDRRLGGAVVWNLPFGKSLRPSLLVGAGYGQSTFGKGELHAAQGYGEVGAGLQYRLTRSLFLTADVRAGTRTTNDDIMYAAKGGSVNVEEEENYSRARIGGMFYF